MTTFNTTREAKEFLAGKIADEAKREGAPLSEVEEKMLYFSETAWTLPDMMEVDEAFDRDLDMVEYEERIGGLVKRYLDRVRKTDAQELAAWTAALKTIQAEDHYLLVLIDGSPEDRRTSTADNVMLLLGGLLLTLVALVVLYLWSWWRDRTPPH